MSSWYVKCARGQVHPVIQGHDLYVDAVDQRDRYNRNYGTQDYYVAPRL